MEQAVHSVAGNLGGNRTADFESLTDFRSTTELPVSSQQRSQRRQSNGLAIHEGFPKGFPD
jgi:hypothetical protein